MKYKNKLVLVAVVAMVLSIMVWAVKGLNFGIEFTGGTSIRYPLAEKVTSTEVLAVLNTPEIQALDLELSPPQPYSYLDAESGTQNTVF